MTSGGQGWCSCLWEQRARFHFYDTDSMRQQCTRHTFPKLRHSLPWTTHLPVCQHNWHTCKRTQLLPRLLRQEERRRKTEMLADSNFIPFPISYWIFNPFLYHSQHVNASVLLSPHCPLSTIKTLRLLQRKELEVMPRKCVITDH